LTSNKTNINLEEYEEYTQKELNAIDTYKSLSDNTMEDEEIYELIIKYNYDDARIRDEVLRQRELIKKKGEEYSWKVAGKPKTEKKKEYSKEIKGKKPQTGKDQKKQYKPRDEYVEYDEFGQKKQYKPRDEYVEYDEFGQFPISRSRGRGARRGNRGNRGGRRTYDENVVEKHLTSEPQPERIENTPEEKKAPESNVVDVPETIHPNVEQAKSHVSPKKNENIISEHFKPTTFKTEKQSQPFDNNIHSNVVESVFQQTIDRDRESEMNTLFEDEKGSKKALSIEDFIEHFMKGVQVCPKVTNFTYAASKAPEKQQTKNQEKYTQPSSSATSTTSSSTNKNFPQKSPFSQPQHFPENMGYGQHPMMYPWMVPNPEVNPQLYQQYQQMMPMFYQMFNPMMYQQQMQEGENYEGSKGGQKNQPKGYSNMPMPQMGYPGYSGENQNFYGGGGSQKNEENQSNFQNYYYGNK